MLYQTFHLPQNPQREYQRRGGVWYYRKIGSNDVYLQVDQKNQAYMESYFSKRYGFLYQYSLNAKIGAVAVVLLGIYGIYKLKQKSGLSKL